MAAHHLYDSPFFLQLPQGPIHADLFHDNVLFGDSDLGGILDFDYACDDTYVFDLAVLLNDWCTDSDGSLFMPRAETLLTAYQEQRPLTSLEIQAIPVMLCVTALRFWLSRLYDKTFPLAGELTFSKDPGVFRKLLALHLNRDRAPEFIFPS